MTAPIEPKPLFDSRAILGDLLSAIAPEIGHAYIVATSAVAGDAKVPWHVAGCTSRNMDLCFQGLLESNGEWRGRQAAILIDDKRVFESAFEYAIRQVAAIAIHEAAHVFRAGVDRSPPATPCSSAVHLEVMNYDLARPDCTLPPFHDHDGEFVRRCLHLLFRARQHNWFGTVLPSQVFMGHAYSLSSAQDYWHQLLPECERLIDYPLGHLALHRPPEGFIELWRRDVSAYRDQQKTSSSLATAVIDDALQLWD